MNEAETNVWATSIVDRALTKVLGTILGTEAPLAISYGSNHETLWALDDESLKTRFDDTANNGVILIWDGQSATSTIAGRNTAEYLNPLTWALCAVRKFPSLQITILDCDATKHSKGKFYRMLQVIAPAQRPFRLLANPSRCVVECLTFLKQPREDSTTAIALLTHQVKVLLTERGEESDHHALANIVGPLILMGNKTAVAVNPAQSALYKLFREVGLLGPIKSSGSSKEDNKSLFGGRSVRLLLVDDQKDHGWEAWVTEMVKESSCTVEAMSTPDALVRAVEEGLAQEGTDSDCRFRLRLPSVVASSTQNENIAASEDITTLSDLILETLAELYPDAPQPLAVQPIAETVLLLDLRLFSLRTRLEEAAFLREKLLPLCRRFESRQGTAFAWPGFSSEELKLSDKWCANPARNTEAHLVVLSLLPRLLALCDMSLPIVLFSSTGERRNIQLLKPYGNIITDFEKPRLAGLESPDLVEETEARFRAALAKASDWSQASAKIRALRSLPLDQYDRAVRAFAGKQYIEIFHEECRSPEEADFRVATFAVAFPQMEDADRTNEYIVRNGPWFFGALALAKTTDLSEGRNQWKTELTGPLKMALQAGIGPNPSLLPFIVVSGEKAAEQTCDDPFALMDPSGLDNVNQDILRLLLEVMLVDTLAWIVDAKAKCCVFGATRMRCQIVHRRHETSVRRALWDRWRIGADRVEINSFGGTHCEVKWQSLRLDSLHVVLNELLSARNKSKKGTAFANAIDKAYCTTLPYGRVTSPAEGYRYLHSIADPISRLVDIDPRNRSVTWGDLETNSDFPMPARGVAGFRDQVVRILNCHRALDEGDLVDGFGYGLGVNHAHDVAGNIVAMRMRDMIPRISGEDFMRIVRHVSNNGPRWTHSPRLHGSVAFQGRQSHTPRPVSARPMPAAAPMSPATTAGPAKTASSSEKAAAKRAFEELKKKWKIRMFADRSEYDASGGEWHLNKPGFLVRQAANPERARVTVFAELGRLQDCDLQGFVEPMYPNQFREDGTPCGRPLEFPGGATV